MTVQTWTFLIVGLTFALYIGIAIWARAGSTHEFYVAGGGVHPVANGLATAADWMSAASFLSMAGIISFAGYDGSVYLMGWTGGYVLLALLLAPYLRKFGKFTVPDFIGDRYYSNTARSVAVVCAIVISFTYVAGQMRGVGLVFSRFLEVEIDTGVYIGTAIVFFYAIMGGMKGITYTQVAQYCVLIFAFMVPAIFISLNMTGHFLPQLGFIGEVSDGSGVALLDKLDGLHRDLGFAEYTSGQKSTIDVFAITFALMVGTAGLPHVIVRFFTVPKVKDARISAGWALLFIAILYTTAPAIAAFARTNLIDTIHNQPYAEIPEWFTKWETTGLIAWTDKNADGIITYGPGLASNPGVTNELYIDNDIMVLANPEIAGLPNWVIALVAAGGLAAALSTAAGLLLVISTALSRDLMKMQIKPSMSDREELWWARGGAAGAVVVAAYFGIHPPGFVAATVALAFGLAAASFFPAIVLGIFDKRMNREGAVAGMVVGILLMFGYMAVYKLGWFVAEVPPASSWWFGISPEGFGTVAMLVNFAVSLVVSRLTTPPPQAVQDIVEDIRIPRGAGEAHLH
ncbi:sodium:solute symporter family protein [Neolewinella lacunae]|uniref:Cation acetate symporter n=1 Tax=Neolewinella lacunae TaxID=1517758 RepID=A0A923PKI5_9BACT|nr:sodium:solute symporter family protein [Neolewinella lacunae]MBC6993376.1 cation acetate symporter [Neolewinella lacunae]MDN3635166.1 sodium:solute symporter family protein [Neolewinella lacunae]